MKHKPLSLSERLRIEEVRRAVYARAKGRCELNLSAECIPGVLPWDGETAMDHGHMVHIRNKRMWGTSVENCLWGCWKCHLIEMHSKGRKPNAAVKHTGS
jgi:hypothetical protein